MYDEIKQNLRLAYNQSAQKREQTPASDWKITERANFLGHLQQAQAQTLLEIGAGTGRDSLFFQQNGLIVTCTDLSPEHIKLCQSKGLKAQVMDFSQLQFPDNSFDALYALNCLLHVPKKELPSVLNEIKRVLKPGGLFFMSVYGGQNFEGVWQEDHHHPKRFFAFYPDETLKEIASQYFTLSYFRAVTTAVNKPNSPHPQILILHKTV